MRLHPTRLPPPPKPERHSFTPSPEPRPELLGNPDPRFAESARRVGLARDTLYYWFPPCRGRVIIKALLSRPTLTLPEVARQLWVTPQTVRTWFPLPVRVQLLRFLLLHSKLSLAKIARRLGGGPQDLDAWLPPDQRFRIAKELLNNPDPRFAESSRRVGLSTAGLYNWFPPTFPGHVIIKTLLSRPTLNLPDVARRLWVTPQTVRAWFPLPVRVQLVRFLLLHSKLSLAKVARRLGGGPQDLDAWLPPDQRFRIAKELLKNPDPRFAESSRRVGLSRKSLYNWFPPTFPGHVIIKALLSRPTLTLPDVARRLWVTPQTVRAWIPERIQVRLVRFLLIRAGLTLTQVADRLGIPAPTLLGWFPPKERSRLARRMLLRFDVPLSWIANQLHLPAHTLPESYSPQDRFRLVSALVLRSEVSMAQVARRLGVPRLSQWFPWTKQLHVARVLLLRTDLSLVEVADRLGVGPHPPARGHHRQPFHLQGLPPSEQRKFIRALVVHTRLSPAQIARKLDVPSNFLLRWIPNLKLKGTEMTKARPLHSRRIGYARVSTLDQDPQHQIKALKASGCSRIFTDQISGTVIDRPALKEALDFLTTGDTLVVWKFDRLGRSLPHLIEIINDLDERGVHLHSLTQGIDTTTPMGRMVFSIMAALSEFERSVISERTRLAAQRRKELNQRWGRPSQFHDPERVKYAQRLLRSHLTRTEVARRLGTTLQVLYKWFPGGEADRFGEGSRGVGLPASQGTPPSVEEKPAISASADNSR